MESSQDSRLKAAIIGCGNAGEMHARAYASDNRVNLAGVSCTLKNYEERRRKIEKSGLGVRLYIDVKEMISDIKPDIVDICSPHFFHYEHAQLALGFDFVRALMIEKPLVYDGDVDSSLRKAGRIIGDCLDKKVLLGCALQTEKLGQVYFGNVSLRSGKFVVEWQSADGKYRTGREKGADILPHVRAIMGRGFNLDRKCFEGNKGKAEMDGSVFCFDGVAKIKEGVDVPLLIRAGGKDKVGRRCFGFEGDIWYWVYDAGRDGYIASNKEGKEIHFVPNPMKKLLEDFVDMVCWQNTTNRLTREQLKASYDCLYDSLESALSILK